MRIVVTRPAERDIAAIFTFVAVDSPNAARRIIDRLDAGLRRLSRMPERGRPGAVEGTRELILDHGYVATYRIRHDIVEILRVRHGRQAPLA